VGGSETISYKVAVLYGNRRTKTQLDTHTHTHTHTHRINRSVAASANNRRLILGAAVYFCGEGFAEKKPAERSTRFV